MLFSPLYLLFAVSLASHRVQVVIETEILKPDRQAGLKSRHVVLVDFDRKEITDVYETGTTELFGVELQSVRDQFQVSNAQFTGEDSVTFQVIGETASGVRALPNINYKFSFEVLNSGATKISGCHDAYPAYRIIVNGIEQYSYDYESTDLLALFGACDIEVAP